MENGTFCVNVRPGTSPADAAMQYAAVEGALPDHGTHTFLHNRTILTPLTDIAVELWIRVPVA